MAKRRLFYHIKIKNVDKGYYLSFVYAFYSFSGLLYIWARCPKRTPLLSSCYRLCLKCISVTSKLRLGRVRGIF